MNPTLQTTCPDCGGCGVVENPQWAAWWKRHNTAEQAWRAAHPGQYWEDSAEYAALDADVPDDGVPAEDPCPTCEGHGDDDRLAGAALALHDAVGSVDDPAGLLAAVQRWRNNGFRPADGEALRQHVARIAALAATASRVVQAQIDHASAQR